ncbi:MAG: restriction endonuclease subunit S, partial [Pseudomonadaceae bacterium]|nr:restriction endonuclease subunit S [Pseudomonadaceae bacterium]
MSEYNVPVGWAQCDLGEYLYLKNGFAFKSTSYVAPGLNTAPIIRISDIDGRFSDDSSACHVNSESFATGFEVEKGDLLIAMSGATTGKFGIYKGNTPAFQNQRVGNIKLINKDLGDLAFRNNLIKFLSADILKEAYGGAQPNISGTAIENIQVLLPPLAEQTRIAQKLDELLAQVDTLKARIDGIPALLKRFRQSVLAAAVSGRLTEEWRDSGASISVCALGDVCDFRNGFAYKSSDYKKTGIPLVRISDIDGKNSSPSSEVFVDEGFYDARFSVSKGDLLIAMSGATTGKVGVYQSETKALQNQRVGNILVKAERKITPTYRNIVVFQMSGDIIKNAYGGAQPNISSKDICSMLINLPCVEEQT